jgi:hypothetical protein
MILFLGFIQIHSFARGRGEGKRGRARVLDQVFKLEPSTGDGEQLTPC